MISVKSHNKALIIGLVFGYGKEPYTRGKMKIKFELNLSNYATKSNSKIKELS